MVDYKKFKDVWVREGLQVDKDMVNQCLNNYKDFDDLDGAVVMDWGMNVGGFGAMMLKHPIKQYIGVECHPENFEVASRNLSHDSRVTLINAAVTSVDLDSIDLYLTKSKQAFCSGTINLKNASAKGLRKVRITVPTVNATEIMDQYQPTHWKCDIEGEEYRIFDHWDWKIPDHVKQMAIEFHWQDRVLDYEYDTRDKITNQGFQPVLEDISYVKGTKPFQFLGKDHSYRNIWGMDCLYKR